ncbi:MAG TPA: UbiA-like polyprenyltransferase [Bacteroidales bacterium]|nr:UbiA-like polyprenyltransferase [Bacteroidales bacterium]HPS17469.1 UbiA-like polyprenyltransferase [Bacteroidales bacterium]
MKIFSSIAKYFSLVKFSHTVFALPFAFIGFFLGSDEIYNNFDIKLFLLVFLCMVLARSSAMAFNRYLDRSFDKKNPRTAIREIPSGKISPTTALVFTIVSATAFIVTTYFINLLCFFLSPVALLVIMGYSYTKRFTPLCHLVLGLGLALAPIGAYIAVTAHFAVVPVLYSFAVLFWVSGFDIIYALQDIEFDKSQNLKSIPVVIGIKNSLILSGLFHFVTAAIIIYNGIFLNFGMFYWIGSLIYILLLIYQHLIVKPSDLSRINLAFVTLNGFASISFGVFVIAEIISKWLI